MTDWPVIIVPGWKYLEPDFRDELAAYSTSGGKLLLIGSEPAELFATELAKPGSTILSVESIDEAFADVLAKALPEPVVEVAGTNDVDVSPRTLNGELSIHLVNTSGPHANAPDGGITEVEPLGPLTISIRLKQAPKSITLQPGNEELDVVWDSGKATVTVPKLALYSILVVKP